MAAVVAPVGVDHAQLGHGGVAVLAAEVLLAEGQVVEVHGQAVLLQHAAQRVLVRVDEAGEGGDGLGQVVLHLQRFNRVQRGLALLHGVDQIIADGGLLLIVDLAGEHVHHGGADQRAVAAVGQLDALAGGIGALVELAGQVLRRQHPVAALGQHIVDLIGLGLGEHGGDAAAEQILVQALHVVAVQQAQAGELGDAQEGADVLQGRVGLVVEAGALFNKYSVNHAYCSFSRS